MGCNLYLCIKLNHMPTNMVYKSIENKNLKGEEKLLKPVYVKSNLTLTLLLHKSS